MSMNYGYESDEVKSSPFNFGLNAGTAFLTKFGWINNAGKEGAPGEALDIVFTINGTEKNYRMFPVTKAFGENNTEVTDPEAPEMKEAVKNFNAVVTHILHAYVNIDTIKTALGRPFESFKAYCDACKALLPGAETPKIPMDIFLQWQWQISGENKRTYLEIQKKMSYGRWLTKTTPSAKWEAKIAESFDTSTQKALTYVRKNAEGMEEEHPFVRNGWFMESNFAKQQKIDSENTSGYAATQNGSNAAPAAPAATPQQGANPSGW